MRQDMRQQQTGRTWPGRTAAALLLATVAITGCRIDSNKHGEGDNVKIATPFGGMQVRTDNADVLAGIGLPAYPGATLVKKQKHGGKGDDNGSADINMSFGSFQLKIKATEYRTEDAPEKVFTFYNKALQRFGNVIQCRNDKPVGMLTHTDEGLTCEEDHHTGDRDLHVDTQGSRNGISAFDGNTRTQLKAGSKKHQHIVDITPENGGSKFGLVSLDLPSAFNFGISSNKGEERDEQ